MSDQRSVMKEFRFLDQKRQASGLTAEEQARYAQLRDLVGAETAAAPRAGFDVNAAAARLRESLLPGGLRSAAPAPPPEPEPLPPEPEAAPEALALEAAWAEQPFAPLEAEPAPAVDPLFDPTSLAAEVRPQAWNPEAPGYDPNAPYDEAAWIAAGYDPNATYDWSGYYGADGQPVPPEAAAGFEAPAAEPALELDLPAELPAEAPLDLAAEPAMEPAFDPGVAPAAEPAPPAEEVEAISFEEALPENAWYAGTPAAEAAPAPEPAPDAWASAAIEVPEPELAPEAPPASTEGLPFDPNAPFDHAKWFGRPTAAPAAPGPEAAPIDPAAVPEPEIAELEPLAEEPDLELEPPAPEAAEPAPAAWGDPQAPSVLEASSSLVADGAPGAIPWTDVAAPAPEPLDLSAELAPEPAPEPIPLPDGADLAPAEPEASAAPVGAATPEAWFDPSGAPPAAEPGPALDFGEYDADARGAPAGLAALLGGPLPEPPPPAPDLGEPLGDGSDTPYQHAPAGAPLGEYDELSTAAPPPPGLDGDALAAMPFDLAAASAVAPGAPLEGFDLAPPPPEAAPAPAAAGGYDDDLAFPASADYGGPEGDSLPGGAPLELPDPVQDWQPEVALEQGFELASDGSFGEAARPALTPVPGWAQAMPEPVAPPPLEVSEAAWESPPALDLAAPFDLAPPPAEPPAPEPLEAAELEPVPEPEPLAEEAPEQTLVLSMEPEAAPEPAAWAEPEPALDPILEPALEPILEPVVEAAPEPSLWAPPTPPAAEEIPPEIAAAFGDGPADPFTSAPPPPADPFAGFAPPPLAAEAEPEPLLEEIPPEPAPLLEPEPLPAAEAPQVWIQGSHRVVLHTVDGQVKRGLLIDAALDAGELVLVAQGPAEPEVVGTDNVKAIFFMLAPGEKAAPPEGKKVRVTFRDGRQVAGYSPDYQDGTIGFFMIPADTRTNTGRIWVYQAAVRQVAVS